MNEALDVLSKPTAAGAGGGDALLRWHDGAGARARLAWAERTVRRDWEKATCCCWPACAGTAGIEADPVAAACLTMKRRSPGSSRACQARIGLKLNQLLDEALELILPIASNGSTRCCLII